MPCRDYDPGTDYSSAIAKIPSKKEVELKDKLDLATRVACDLSTGFAEYFSDQEDTWIEEIEALKSLAKQQYISNESCDWFIKHRIDEQAHRDELKKSALAKLTDEEKEALGIR